MSISTKLKEALSSLPYWENMVGSQFVMGLALLVEKIGERYAQVCERALQESRMSTATKRSSILAEAQDRGYVGRKVTPSVGDCLITNNSASFVGIPIGTSVISSNGVPYALLDAVDLATDSNKTVDVAQLELRVIEFKVTEIKKHLEILLNRGDSAITHKIDVFVKASDEAAYLPYQLSYMFRGTDETSTQYTEFYTPTEQLGVRFGNGVYGAIPSVGSTIRLEVWCSLGVSSLMAGEKLSFNDDTYNTQCSIVASTSIVGGQPAETTEELKMGAMYSTQYDNQIVWRDDYIAYIKENVAGLAFLNVWGEQQQEIQDGAANLKNNRTIFISAYSSTAISADLETEILTLLNQTTYLNRVYRFTASIISGLPFVFSGTVSRTVAIDDANSILRQAVESKYGLGQLPVTPKTLDSDAGFQIIEKDLWTLIDSLKIFTDFTLTITNLDAAQNLEEYRYIDLNNAGSTITIGYGGFR